MLFFQQKGGVLFMEPSKLASLPFFQGISPEDVTKLLGELDAREVFYEKGPANGTEEQPLPD